MRAPVVFKVQLPEVTATRNVAVWQVTSAPVQVQTFEGIVVNFPATPSVVAVPVGAQGPPGDKWVEMTQAAYDALTPKDPDTLYVVIG